MRLLALAVLLGSFVAAAGCVQARGTWQTSRPLPPLGPGEPVPLYLAKTAPDWVVESLGPHAVAGAAAPWGALPVAEIEARAGFLGSYGTMVEGVRDAARDLGADTVVASGTPDVDAARVVFFRLMRRAPVD